MIKIGFGLPFTIPVTELIIINKQVINHQSREKSLLQIFLFLAKYFGAAKLLLSCKLYLCKNLCSFLTKNYIHDRTQCFWC